VHSTNSGAAATIPATFAASRATTASNISFSLPAILDGAGWSGVALVAAVAVRDESWKRVSASQAARRERCCQSISTAASSPILLP